MKTKNENTSISQLTSWISLSLFFSNPKYAAYFFIAGYNKGCEVLASTRKKDQRSGSCYTHLDLKRKMKMVPYTSIAAKCDSLEMGWLIWNVVADSICVFLEVCKAKLLSLKHISKPPWKSYSEEKMLFSPGKPSRTVPGASAARLFGSHFILESTL